MSNEIHLQEYRDLAFKLIKSYGGNEKLEVLGFFLALHKQDKLHSVFSVNNLGEYLLDLGDNKTFHFFEINHFTQSINEIESTIHEIQKLNTSDISLSLLFEEIISIYTKDIQPKGEFVQPKEVSLLVSKLYGDCNGKKIYNPFAGIGSYQILNKNAHFISQELNWNTWFIGCIRLFLNGIKLSDFNLENSIEKWKGNDTNFDAVFSTPPYGVKLNNIDNLLLEPLNDFRLKPNTIEGFLLKQSLDCIKVGGCILSVISPQFLSSDSEIKLREFLIENGFINSIILLPANIFNYTNIQLAIIKLTKSYNEKIIMVDGSSFYTKESRKNTLDHERLLYTIEKQDSQYVQAVPLDAIAEFDYKLKPKIFINHPFENIKIQEGYTLVKLIDLITLYNRGKCQKDKSILIKGQDLANNKFDFEKNFKDLPFDKPNSNYSILDKDLLLLLRIGNLKPTLFKYNDDVDVCCNQNILSFEVNNAIVNSLYLVNELSKEYVSKQVSALSSGATIPSINIKDILRIEVLIPNLGEQSLEVQKAIYENEKYNYSLAKAKELGLEALLEKQQKDFIDDIRIKRHQLRQYLAEITSNVHALNKYFDNHNLGENIISKIQNITLSDHLKMLLKSTDEMDKKLELLTQIKEFGESIALNIKEALKIYESKNNYIIEFSTEREDDDKNSFISFINKDDFHEVIQNIIINAEVHGFNRERTDNIIRINLYSDIDNNMNVIKISNNGKPMPKGMNTRRYGIKGEKAGVSGNEGIGGYRVKSIIEHFKGSYSVDNDENSLFPVQITIKLPKNN